MQSTYQSYLLYTRDPGNAYQRAAAQPLNAREEDYYRDNISKVRTVDDFIGNYRLFSYAMKAFNLEDMTYAKAFMKKVLLSDLSDQTSFANKLTDPRYRTFAEAFQFDTSGSVLSTAVTQSPEQASDTLAKYRVAAGVNSVSSLIETAFLAKAIPALTSVDDLVKNKRLFSDVLTAYGLDANINAKTIVSALESDLSEPSSFVNRNGKAALRDLVADFNFDADGKVTTERIAQTKGGFSRMAKLYAHATIIDEASRKAAAAETTYVWKVISSARSLDTIVKDKRVAAYIGKAFGDAVVDEAKLRAVLTSDLEDPRSIANMLGPKYQAMAASFQFTAKGTIARELSVTAQLRSGINFATRSYLQNSMEAEAGKDNVGVKLALYFARKAPDLKSTYELLSDKALFKFVQTAFQLPTSTGVNVEAMARTIEKKLTINDLRDPEKVNKLVARFAALYDMQNGDSQQSLVLQLFGAGNGGSASTPLSTAASRGV